MKTLQRLIKLFLILNLIFFALISPPTSSLSRYSPTFTKFNVAFASETKWARVLDENTPFYSDSACTMVKFYLPYTYFVKVINIGDDVTRVIYMDGQSTLPQREGYIKTCDLHIFDGIPTNPYPQVGIKITADEILFADSNKKYPKTVLTQGEEATYYGELTVDNEKFCYVYCNGYIGYVRKSAFAPFELPLHEIPIKTATPEDSLTSEIIQLDSEVNVQSVTALDSTMKIVIIIAVAVTCISVIYLLFRPKILYEPKVAAWRDNDDF